jgi:hypothetical protein
MNPYKQLLDEEGFHHYALLGVSTCSEFLAHNLTAGLVLALDCPQLLSNYCSHLSSGTIYLFIL